MTNKTDCIVHIALADKREGIPAMGDGKACEREGCPGPQGWDVNFGLAGGGYGVYNYCATCGEVKEKDCETEVTATVTTGEHGMDKEQEHENRIAFLGAMSPEGMLRELLATLHGDGGHYVIEHGLAAAVADAELLHYTKGEPAAHMLHREVMDVIEGLMLGDPPRDTPAGKALSRLAAAVEDYEKMVYPMEDEQPGEDRTGVGMMAALREILDGKDKGEGVCNEPWESLRRRVLELVVKGEVVVTWAGDSIVAVTRQDEEGRILSMIAEAGSPPPDMDYQL